MAQGDGMGRGEGGGFRMGSTCIPEIFLIKKKKNWKINNFKIKKNNNKFLQGRVQKHIHKKWSETAY